MTIVATLTFLTGKTPRLTEAHDSTEARRPRNQATGPILVSS